MDNTKKFTIEYFSRIDEVRNSKNAKEAYLKAYDIASLSTNGRFIMPNEEEFLSIIKGK